VKLWWRRDQAIKARDALCRDEFLTQGFFLCVGCGWGFRYLGNGHWHGPYWPKTHIWEPAFDSKGEWSGSPHTMNPETLSLEYADCFGKLKWKEPPLQRGWSGVHAAG